MRDSVLNTLYPIAVMPGDQKYRHKVEICGWQIDENLRCEFCVSILFVIFCGWHMLKEVKEKSSRYSWRWKIISFQWKIVADYVKTSWNNDLDTTNVIIAIIAIITTIAIETTISNLISTFY